jgi:hypothetical protein
MTKPLPFEIFRIRANDLWKERFDYSRVKYESMHKKIEIVCAAHGNFFQSPANHLAKKIGCSDCYKIDKEIKKIIIIAQFAEKFFNKVIEKFNNKFDYSESKYSGKDTPIKISCPIHGQFKQTPQTHLRSPHGCKKCRFNSPQNKDKFIERAILVHGSKYDYSKVKYKTLSDKILIICPLHGEFLQKGSNHLYGQGCSKCGLLQGGKSQVLNTEEFVRRAKESHGNIFDYEKTKYINNYTDVIVSCKRHGDFPTNPNNHTRKNKPVGCKLCADEKLRKERSFTKEQFLKIANKIHKGKYCYDKVKYKNARIKVTIICPYHSNFEQTPDVHNRGVGCPDCGHEIVNIGQTLHDYRAGNKKVLCDFYLLICSGEREEFLKVGITTKSVDLRYPKSGMPYTYKILFLKNMDLGDAYELEQTVLKKFKKKYHYYPQIDFGGRTECLKVNALEKIQVYLGNDQS